MNLLTISFDFIKAILVGANPDYLKQKLEFIMKVNEATGEIGDTSVADYGGMKVYSIKNWLIKLVGSIHIFKNGGEHNYDSFTHQELCSCIEKLEKELQIDSYKCPLNNIEYGINIPMPQEEIDLILDGLLFHYGSEFKEENLPKGRMKVLEHNQYTIKVYDKGKQYMVHPILRIEVHYSCMWTIGKYTLGDLMDVTFLEKCAEDLIDKWTSILFFDSSIPFHSCPVNVQKKEYSWSNPKYWKSLSPEAMYREKKKLDQVTIKNSQNYKSTITQILNDTKSGLIMN